MSLRFQTFPVGPKWSSWLVKFKILDLGITGIFFFHGKNKSMVTNYSGTVDIRTFVFLYAKSRFSHDWVKKVLSKLKGTLEYFGKVFFLCNFVVSSIKCQYPK